VTERSVEAIVNKWGYLSR